MKHLAIRLTLAVGIACAFSRPALSQIRVESKPTSDHFITLKLNLPDHSPVQLTVQDGTMARVRRQSDGATIGVAPRITDPATRAVAVMVVGITTLDDGSEMAQALETLRLNPSGQATALISEAPWNGRAGRMAEAVSGSSPMLKDVTHLGVDTPIAHVRPPQASTAPGAGSMQPNMLPNTCCLTRDGWEFCGCAVECNGNYCCEGRCCDGG